MARLTQLSCEDFVEQLASKAPTPGGGGAAALMGALGMALGSMVGSLTLGKQAFAGVEEDIKTLMVRAQALQCELLELVSRDAEVFEPLARAYGMPKGTEEEAAARQEVMESCLRECCEVPYAIMRACALALELHEQFAALGTPLALSDVGCGVAACKAALQAASLNIAINTKAMTNRAVAAEFDERAQSLLEQSCTKADALYAEVAQALSC